MLHAGQATVPDIAALVHGETTLNACGPRELRPTRLPVPIAVWDVLGERKRENMPITSRRKLQTLTHSSRCYRAGPHVRCTCRCIPETEEKGYGTAE